MYSLANSKSILPKKKRYSYSFKHSEQASQIFRFMEAYWQLYAYLKNCPRPGQPKPQQVTADASGAHEDAAVLSSFIEKSSSNASPIEFLIKSHTPPAEDVRVIPRGLVTQILRFYGSFIAPNGPDNLLFLSDFTRRTTAKGLNAVIFTFQTNMHVFDPVMEETLEVIMIQYFKRYLTSIGINITEDQIQNEQETQAHFSAAHKIPKPEKEEEKKSGFSFFGRKEKKETKPIYTAPSQIVWTYSRECMIQVFFSPKYYSRFTKHVEVLILRLEPALI
ncbi:hypothetical protein EDD86DRAFT_9615 [Gorgonomyces haynaldii]|nr:hypothetical protein EDD86DRAFT_9615 [Gorgonomyces haynaldii]